MSFDVNIGRYQPAIKAASNMNNDGGSGGNTGYMMSGQNRKKKNNQALFDFDTNDEKDTFEHYPKINNDEEEKNIKNLIKNIVKKICS